MKRLVARNEAAEWLQFTRRDFLSMAGYATAGAALAACGFGSTTSPQSSVPKGSTVPLKILMVSGASGVDFWTGLVKQWNETQTDFKIDLQMSQDSNDNIKTTYKTNLASQNPPDIVFLFAGHRWIPDVVNAGLVADLTSYDKKYGWRSRFDAGVYNDWLYKNTLYQVGYSAVPHAFVWYNKDLFNQLGLQVPANRRPSMSDFTNYIATSKAAGLQPVAFGDKDTWPGGHFVTMMMLRNMSLTDLAKLRPDFWQANSAKWTDPGPIKALQAAQDAAKAGWFNKGFNGLSDGDASQLFATGKATMYQTGFWAVQTIPPVNPKLNFDFFHYPQMDQSIPVSLINFASVGVVISSKSKYKDQAAALVNLALDTPGQRLLFEQFNAYPATKALSQITDLKYPHPVWPAILSEVANTPNTPFQIENDSPASVAPDALTNLQALLSGSMSAQTWATQFQSGLNSANGG
jgi:raffinose/stachyose/melibiose transport system substrate-binding protein